MVNFKNKFSVKLIASLCVFLTLLNFGISTRVYADNGQVFGGVLLTPVMQLLSGIGDAILDILHATMLEQEESLIRLDGSADTWWNRHGARALGWLAAIVVVVVVVVTVIPSGGASAVAGAGVLAKIGAACFVIKTAAVAIAAGTVSGILVARVVDSAMMGDDIYLPVYRVTPEEIFANDIPLLDINFFNPNEYYIVDKADTGTVIIENKQIHYTQNSLEFGRLCTKAKDVLEKNISIEEARKTEEFKKIIEKLNSNIDQKIDNENFEFRVTKAVAESGVTWGGVAWSKETTRISILYKSGKEYLWLECYYYSSSYSGDAYYNDTGEEKITFTITNAEDPGEFGDEIPKVQKDSMAAELKSIVSKWYFILRNLALLVLMVVLIYTGIKIVISSTAGEKAKYKERLIDWLVAMCLVFVMHYIMVFAIELNEKIIDLIDSPSEEHAVEKDIVLSNENHINKITKDDRLSQYLTEQDGYKILSWGTNLMGGMRIEQQLVYEGTANWVGYVLCFLVLVIYTLIFTWTYLKRVLYMAFLTIIAPLVAMTYPIDKITDGKAQAFNAWMKEYIFNLLIQPFHLLLYVILVGSAYELAGKNPLYAVVAVGFMTPAEKLLRKFFGFNKAQTPGLLSGAAGTALAMTGLQSLMKFGKKGKGGTHDNDEDSKDNNKIKFSSSDGVNPKGVVADSIGETKQESSNQAEEHQTEEHQSGETSEKNNSVKTVQVPIPPTTGKTATSNGDSSKEEKNIKNKKKSAFKRGMRTIGAGIAGYGRGLGNKMYKRINKGRPIRAMARGLAGLAGATAFGMAGLALGIASGDPSKAFQYTTAGMVGGLGLGKGLAGNAVDALTVDSQKIKDEMEMTYYGEDYKQIKLEEEKNQMQHDEEYIDYIRATLGVSRAEAEKILKTTGGECFDAGIRSAEDIAAIERMTEEETEERFAEWEKENKEALQKLDEKDKEEKIQEARAQIEEEERRYAIAMKKFSDRTPDLTKLGEKKVESYRSQFKIEMEKEFYERFKRQGMNEEEARSKSEDMAIKAADSIISGIIKFDDAKSSILKA